MGTSPWRLRLRRRLKTFDLIQRTCCDISTLSPCRSLVMDTLPLTDDQDLAYQLVLGEECLDEHSAGTGPWGDCYCLHVCFDHLDHGSILQMLLRV